MKVIKKKKLPIIHDLFPFYQMMDDELYIQLYNVMSSTTASLKQSGSQSKQL